MPIHPVCILTHLTLQRSMLPTRACVSGAGLHLRGPVERHGRGPGGAAEGHGHHPDRHRRWHPQRPPGARAPGRRHRPVQQPGVLPEEHGERRREEYDHDGHLRGDAVHGPPGESSRPCMHRKVSGWYGAGSTTCKGKLHVWVLADGHTRVLTKFGRMGLCVPWGMRR